MPRPPQPSSDSVDPDHVQEDLLEAFAMGTLRGAEAERVQTHVEACDDCCLRLVQIAEFIEALDHGLRGLSGEDPEESPGQS